MAWENDGATGGPNYLSLIILGSVHNYQLVLESIIKLVELLAYGPFYRIDGQPE